MNGADPIEEVTARLLALIATMQPDERRKLSRAIGKRVRRSQSLRIQAQQDPDGDKFKPRATPPPGSSKKRMRKRVKKMFIKLRQTRWMRIRATADLAEVGFTGAEASRIAWFHQKGLKRANLPARRLLGFSAGEEEDVINEVIDHLADSRR